MSGEINGTTVILSNDTGEIIGQLSMSVSLAGTPIDITNKSLGKAKVLFDGQLPNSQYTISGSLVYNDDVQFKQMRTDVKTAKQRQYTLDYGDGTIISGVFAPTGLSDELPQGDKITSSITLISSGDVTTTALPVASVDLSGIPALIASDFGADGLAAYQMYAAANHETQKRNAGQIVITPISPDWLTVGVNADVQIRFITESTDILVEQVSGTLGSFGTIGTFTRCEVYASNGAGSGTFNANMRLDVLDVFSQSIIGSKQFTLEVSK